MSDSTTPLVNEQVQKTTDANLAEAKQSIQSIEAQLLELKSCIRSIEAVQAEPQYTKEQVTDMLRQAYNLGATAHEEHMSVDTGSSWSDGINVHVDMEDGGFSYSGEVSVDVDVIKDAVTFNHHVMTDEQVEEILNA